MLLRLTWRLPRLATTAALPRRVLDAALRALGVTESCRMDVALALTEACSNAIEHAQAGDDYRVEVSADDEECVVDVVDGGVGLAPRGDPAPSVTAVRGRGLTIIRRCADSVRLTAVHPHGLAVRFSKRLVWEHDAPARAVALHFRGNG